MKSSIIGVIIAVVVIIIIIAVVAATYHPSSVKATLTNYIVYVANGGSDTSVINTATNTVTATVTVGSGSSGVAIGS
jgi:YVTN family beta-propeller protein